MQLTSRQLSSLNEMGIPVWEFRTKKSQSEPVAVSNNSAIKNNAQLVERNWIALIDADNYNEQARRLLQAMFFSIGIEQHQIAIIDEMQFEQLKQVDVEEKVLIIFGDALAQKILGKLVSRGTLLDKTSQINITTLVSFDLIELLYEPSKKADAWQDLQRIKKEALTLKKTLIKS